MTENALTLIADKETPGSGAGSGAAPEPDTGLIGLVMLARFHNVAADPDQLAHDFKISGHPFGVTQILLAAKRLGLKAKLVSTDRSRLEQTPLPALAIDTAGRFFILARIDGDQVLIQDPRVERPQALSVAEFSGRWAGQLILFTSRASLAGELARFDFTWFIPAVVNEQPRSKLRGISKQRELMVRV